MANRTDVAEGLVRLDDPAQLLARIGAYGKLLAVKERQLALLLRDVQAFPSDARRARPDVAILDGEILRIRARLQRWQQRYDELVSGRSEH